jgi:hypothetical protein
MARQNSFNKNQFDHMFGLFRVAPPKQFVLDTTDAELIVGTRNSHDKVFPFGLVWGKAVTVCTNLVFSGEEKISRRHTGEFYNDAPRRIQRAISFMGQRFELNLRRTEVYKKTFIDDSQAETLILRSAFPQIFSTPKSTFCVEPDDENGSEEIGYEFEDLRFGPVIPKTRIDTALEQWYHPKYPEWTNKTLYHLENCLTYAMKNSGIWRNVEQSVSLWNLLDPIASFTTIPNEN